MDSTKYNYKDKIDAIKTYFGISNEAAKYMYHRRRHGAPFKKEDDKSFLKWNIQLQNALVRADKITNFNWGKLVFNSDLEQLLTYNIDVNCQPHTIIKNSISSNRPKLSDKESLDNNNLDESSSSDDGEWTVVSTNKGKLARKHLIRHMGFITKQKNH